MTILPSRWAEVLVFRKTGEVAISPRRDPHDMAVRDPLPRLREQLAAEYGEVVPRETIAQAAEQALGEFEEARIREFVPVFAWRRGRALLRRAS